MKEDWYGPFLNSYPVSSHLIQVPFGFHLIMLIKSKAIQCMIHNDVSSKQAGKLGRCGSYLRNLKLYPTHLQASKNVFWSHLGSNGAIRAIKNLKNFQKQNSTLWINLFVKKVHLPLWFDSMLRLCSVEGFLWKRTKIYWDKTKLTSSQCLLKDLDMKQCSST